MSIINIRPLIYRSSTNKFFLNECCDRHYGYDCGGHPYLVCREIAKKLISRKILENKRNSSGNWTVIELAIIPMPENSQYFYVEDRSTWEPL